MNRQWMEARQTKYAAYVTVYILVILCIVSVANVLANRYNKSYDSTSNKRYSLSDQTAKIVKGLSQPVSITYFDKTSSFQTGKDLLDRYTTLSPKVHLDYVDPDKNPQAARAAGITKYGTTLVQIGAKKEEAKSMTEEDITGAIIRDLKSNTRTVCFLTGGGERQIDDTDRPGLSHLKDMLSKDDYTSKSVSLLEKAEIPPDCTVVVVSGPKSDYQQSEVDAIKKYVEGGGRAMFLLDPPLKIGRATADNDALNNVLQGWGVSMEKNLLLDLSPVGQLLGVGPTIALVSNYDPHPIVNEMKGTATGFPLSRSLTIKNTDKTTVQKLFESSDSSLATTKLDTPNINPSDPNNKRGPLTIAAAGTYTTGKENSQGRFVVVGSSSWVANSFLSFNGNSDLAMNAMNWLSSDEDLISIRPKPQEDRKVNMTGAQFNWVRLSSQFLLPGALLLAGLSVWWRRRERQARFYFIHCETKNMMKMRQLLVATVVLAALAATLYWSNHRKPANDSVIASPSAANAKVISLTQDDISKLEVKKKDGDDVVLNRSGAAKWKIVSPKPLVADQESVSSILYNLSPMDGATLIDEKATDLKQFGLAEPEAQISATGKDGKTHTILVGDETPTGDAAYVMLSGDAKVYSVPKNTKTNLDKGLKDLRDKRLMPVDFDKLSSVEINGGKLHLTFGSDDGQWTVRSPANLRGDTSKMETIIEKLRTATMDPSTSDADMKKDASLFASGAPIATLKATDAAGQQELQIRKTSSGYYAKTSAMDGVYKVPNELGDAVNKDAENFREKRVFDFADMDPEKVELHDGSKAYFLTRSGEDWWSDGKKMDALSVQEFLRTIRTLTATKFSPGGFSSAALSFVVTSKDGKRVEKVDISKSGNGYIAKRAEGPALFVLDATAVEDLRKAAGGLKPAEIPPAKK